MWKQVTLQEARLDARISVEDAARLIGVRPETVRNWESGKTSPKILHARRLAQIYHKRLNDIDFSQKNLTRTWIGYRL